MLRFWLERAMQMLLVIFCVATLTFILMRVSPGSDPARILLTTHNIPASQEAIDALREEMGLTDSLWSQYIRWLGDVFTWQWGTSYMSKEPVAGELLKRLPATLGSGLGWCICHAAGNLPHRPRHRNLFNRAA